MDISKELADILDFYSLLCDNAPELHKDLISYIAESKDSAYSEGFVDSTETMEAFKADPFNEDFELCEQIAFKHIAFMFRDCVALEDFKEVLREAEIQNCIAMPILGL